MANSLEQYRIAVGMHNVYLKGRDYRNCFKGKFWCSLLLLFYMEAINLPVLKKLANNYNTSMFNRFWLTQIYFYQFFIPELICLANDVETNPGPMFFNDNSGQSLKRNDNSSNIEKYAKRSKEELATPFQFHPCNSEDQLFLCSLLNIPLVVKYNSKDYRCLSESQQSFIEQRVMEIVCFAHYHF